jgi:hypothetical protein
MGREVSVLLPPPSRTGLELWSSYLRLSDNWESRHEPLQLILIMVVVVILVGLEFELRDSWICTYHNVFLSQASVVHACNPSYSGGRDQED